MSTTTLHTHNQKISTKSTRLSSLSVLDFSIAAGFGNVHGTYKPGNVKLHPELLHKHQQYVKRKASSKSDKPVFLVFHGGSGLSKKEFSDAISYGVVKVNIDTDTQYGYLQGIRDLIQNEKRYLQSQVSNPDSQS